MQDAPEDEPAPANLRFLKALVTALTLVMMLGMGTLVVLFITRFPKAQSLSLPAQITLPEGATATAFTQGQGWFAIVTTDDHILIYNRKDGALRQTITISQP
jgi:hypothetical protein